MTDSITYRKNFLKVGLGLGVIANLVYIFAYFNSFKGEYLVFGGVYFFMIFLIWKYWDYFYSSYNELSKHVTWTTWSEGQRLTVIVAAFSVVLALLVFGIDTVFSGVIGRYFEWIKS